MMFLWISRASPYTGFNISDNPVFMPIYLLIIGYYYMTYCKKPIKPLAILLSIFAIWSFCIFIKFGNLDNFSFQFIYYLIIAHVAFNIYSKDEFFQLYEDILVKLCILSLVVWVLANLFPASFVPFMHSIAVYENHPPMETTSVLVGVGASFEMGLRRNIGFSWEPGVFSCFVALGIYVNLTANKFRIFPLAKNKKLVILLVTLLTTLSTTGYVLLFALLLFVLMNKSLSGRVLTLTLIVVAIPFIARLSFMRNKILTTMDFDAELAAMNYYVSQGVEKIVPQRFSGFYLECLNFIHDFWFGYGNYTQSYASTIFSGKAFDVQVSNGVVYILAKYGVFVGVFFYYWMIKSSIFLSSTLRYKGKYYFAFMFTIMGFSYDFWENNLLMFFYLSTFYMACSNAYKTTWKY